MDLLPPRGMTEGEAVRFISKHFKVTPDYARRVFKKEIDTNLSRQIIRYCVLNMNFLIG